MSNEKYSLEVVFQIWNDKTGERIEVGGDRDGLNLVEIRSYDDDGKNTQHIVMDNGQAKLVLDALAKHLKED